MVTVTFNSSSYFLREIFSLSMPLLHASVTNFLDFQSFYNDVGCILLFRFTALLKFEASERRFNFKNRFSKIVAFSMPKGSSKIKSKQLNFPALLSSKYCRWIYYEMYWKCSWLLPVHGACQFSLTSEI